MATSKDIQLIAKWVQKHPASVCDNCCDHDLSGYKSPRFIYYWLLLHPNTVMDYVDDHGNMIPGSTDGTGCSHSLSHSKSSCGRPCGQSEKCDLHDNPIFSMDRFRQMEAQ